MAQNATKCSAADGVTQAFDFCHGTPLMVRAVDFNALYAECQKLRKDAERYRWLRDNACTTQANTRGPIFRIDVQIVEKWHLGDAVDAAMADGAA